MADMADMADMASKWRCAQSPVFRSVSLSLSVRFKRQQRGDMPPLNSAETMQTCGFLPLFAGREKHFNMALSMCVCICIIKIIDQLSSYPQSGLVRYETAFN